jgi:hypothetical protein
MKREPAIASTGRRRGGKLLSFVLLLCVTSITVSLFYYAYLADPAQIAVVTPQPVFKDPSIGPLDIRAMNGLKHGLVPVAVSGSISDLSVSRLTLITGSPGSADLSQKQTTCCVIADMTFVGTAQLGTAESPITGTSVLPFQLVSSGSNTVEVAGSLAVSIESLPGGSPLAYKIIGGLSIFATLIAIVQGLPSSSVRAVFPAGRREREPGKEKP